MLLFLSALNKLEIVIQNKLYQHLKTKGTYQKHCFEKGREGYIKSCIQKKSKEELEEE